MCRRVRKYGTRRHQYRITYRPYDSHQISLRQRPSSAVQQAIDVVQEGRRNPSPHGTKRIEGLDAP